MLCNITPWVCTGFIYGILKTETMTVREIAEKYVYGKHNALTDKQEVEDMIKYIEEYAKAINKNSVVPDVSGIITKDGKVCCDQNDDYTIFNTEKSELCDCTYEYGCKLM